MKVLIIAGTSLRYCPYANFYIELLEEAEIDYEVVYPDKAELQEQYRFPTIVYKWNNRNNKYLEMINYRKYVLELLDSKKYEYVVLLTTVLAVLFYSAIRHRRIGYLVDIRDYTHENIKPFYWAERNAINRADCCVISSPGFRAFLPKYPYIDVYNASNDLRREATHFCKNDGNRPIRISYIGTIAYPEQCERLMTLVDKDERFEFCLYGNDLNGDRISSYIFRNQLNRCQYYGPYRPEEKGGIIENSDILFNAYGNDSPLLLYALSNKLTDSAVYLKPVLNSPGTSMDLLLDICSYGIDLENATNLEELYKWYVDLNPSQCEYKLSDVLSDIIETNKKAKHIIREKIYATTRV